LHKTLATLAAAVAAATGFLPPPPAAAQSSARLSLPGAVKSVEVTPVARVRHEPIGEMSGIVKSRRYADTFWVHNDSGDEPRFFAVRADGTTIMPSWLAGDFYVGGKPAGEQNAKKQPYPGIPVAAAAHFDWEDIAYDGDLLYLADVGNNGNARRDLGIYVVAEPNPEAVNATRALRWLPVAYPDQKAFPDPTNWHFDCEAVFVFGGRLHLLTKHRAAGKIGIPEPGTNLYRLDSQHTDRVNVLKRLDGVDDLGGWVTAADVSPDGKTLAVLCQAPVASVWLFDVPRGGDRLLSGSRTVRRLILTGAKQCEALCFEDDGSLLVTNEQREVFRLLVEDFSQVK